MSFLGGFLVTHECSSNVEKKNKRKYNDEEVRVAVVCVKKRLLSGSGNNNLLVKLFSPNWPFCFFLSVALFSIVWFGSVFS